MTYLETRQSLIEREAVKLTAMLLATEKWSPQYSKAPEQHLQFIKQMAQWQITLNKFFKNMAKKAGDYINPQQYDYQLSQSQMKQLDRSRLDYNVDVVVNDQQIDQNDQNFIKVNITPVKKIIDNGAKAAEVMSGRVMPITQSSHIFQAQALKQVAALVGKKIQPDGSIIDNPRAEYNVVDTVRKDIRQSVVTSLNLGETTDEAVARMRDIIDDPYRAELIANTESVNAFQQGMVLFGQQTDAVGKEWDTAGADDICADNEGDGAIPFDGTFSSGDDEPPAHPNCRCSLRLIYPEDPDAADISS